MNRLRLILAVIACKLAIWGSKMLGKHGSSMPGQLAFKIYPGVLKDLSAQIKREIIVVCGTNGKTTTNNLLYSYLSSSGYKVVCNRVGANMFYGVCCAFAAEANIFGKLKSDFACLEVDEASTVKVFAHIKPHKMLITNLFRDQLDRYGEIEQTAGYLKRALEQSPDTELVLNADDPLVAQFGLDKERKCHYIGVDEGIESEKDESYFCVVCGEKLDYEYRHYSQLGKYNCQSCGFKRPELDFKVKEVSQDGSLKFNLLYADKTIPFDVNYRGFYNIYNISLSYAAAVLAVGEIPDYLKILAQYKPQIGRMEEFSLLKTTVLNMAKNPAGFNQAITTVLKDTKTKDILLAVNDYESDGQDISWIWDVDFELLNDSSVLNIITTGIRADELSLRLKYAGIKEEKITKTSNLKVAVNLLQNGGAEVCYALANYTAVFSLYDIFKNSEKEVGANE